MNIVQISVAMLHPDNRHIGEMQGGSSTLIGELERIPEMARTDNEHGPKIIHRDT